MARPGACARVTEVLARYTSVSDWVDRGSKRQAQSELVHEGWDHGPHVTASGCRHDGLHRGSERFFLPSPTKKHVDVEQSRWAMGPRGPRWDWTKHSARAWV
jgi:hypothetical protein